MTNRVAHGRKVDLVRIAEVRGNASPSAFKIAITTDPKGVIKVWGLSPIKKLEPFP